jgi:hypothetical protein
MARSAQLTSSRLRGAKTVKDPRTHNQIPFQKARNPSMILRKNRRQHIVGTRQMAAHSGLGFGSFLTVRIPRSLLSHHAFDNDFDVPTTERARSRSSNARCVYPSLEHCERRLRYSTRSNCSRFRQYPLDHDSSPFPTTPQQRPTVNPRLSRTPWPTIRIMSTSGGIVAMCAKYSIGDWTGNDWMNSTRRSSMRLEI